LSRRAVGNCRHGRARLGHPRFCDGATRTSRAHRGHSRFHFGSIHQRRRFRKGGGLVRTDQWGHHRGPRKALSPCPTDRGWRQYVVGAVHANTVEGFLSILKRCFIGTFNVRRKYLHPYVAVLQIRYNNRVDVDILGTAIADARGNIEIAELGKISRICNHFCFGNCL